MAFTEKNLAKSPTCKRYLAQLGQVPSYHIEKCFDCGLPTVWLYMRSIGMEDLYFVLLQKVKESSIWFRELFYLLIHTNSNNSFFPSLPNDILNIAIPEKIRDAQIDMPQPEFQLAYSFSRDQLIETLQSVALPGKLIRLGNKQQAIAIMRNDDGTFAVYQGGENRPLQFNTIEKCTDYVIGSING